MSPTRRQLISAGLPFCSLQATTQHLQPMHFPMSKWKRYCSPGSSARVGMRSASGTGPRGTARHERRGRRALRQREGDAVFGRPAVKSGSDIDTPMAEPDRSGAGVPHLECARQGAAIDCAPGRQRSPAARAGMKGRARGDGPDDRRYTPCGDCGKRGDGDAAVAREADSYKMWNEIGQQPLSARSRKGRRAESAASSTPRRALHLQMLWPRRAAASASTAAPAPAVSFRAFRPRSGGAGDARTARRRLGHGHENVRRQSDSRPCRALASWNPTRVIRELSNAGGTKSRAPLANRGHQPLQRRSERPLLSARTAAQTPATAAARPVRPRRTSCKPGPTPLHGQFDCSFRATHRAPWPCTWWPCLRAPTSRE